MGGKSKKKGREGKRRIEIYTLAVGPEGSGAARRCPEMRYSILWNTQIAP